MSPTLRALVLVALVPVAVLVAGPAPGVRAQVPAAEPAATTAAPIEPAEPTATTQPATLAERAAAALGVRRVALQRLALPAPGARRPFEVLLELDGRPAAVTLDPVDLRAASFVVRVAGRPDAPGAAPRTYRGLLHRPEGPTHRVAASRLDDGLHLLALDGAGRRFALEPVARRLPDAPADLHAWYALADADPVEGRCADGTSLASLDAGAAGANAGEGTADTGGDVLPLGEPVPVFADTEVAYEVDVTWTLTLGSEIAALGDVEQLNNSVSLIYEQELGIRYLVSGLVLGVQLPGPYDTNNHEVLLARLADQWNAFHDDIPRDVAHLLTARDIVGSVVGAANLATVCKRKRAYGFAQTAGLVFAGRVGLTAHELGHNWDASHCNGDPDCSIMCSVLGGCAQDVTSFGASASQQILGFLGSRGCVEDPLVPLVVPHREGFDAGGKLPDGWRQGSSARATGKARGEPSGKRAVRLRARPAPKTDLLVSPPYDLSREIGARVEFFYQRRGLPAGERLVVEALDVDGEWITLGEIESDGRDDPLFRVEDLDLPPSTHHGGMRLRFRPDGALDGGTWFVDDVFVEDVAADAQPQLCPEPTHVTLSAGTTTAALELLRCGPLGGTLVAIFFESATWLETPFALVFLAGDDAVDYELTALPDQAPDALTSTRVRVQQQGSGSALPVAVTWLPTDAPVFAPRTDARPALPGDVAALAAGAVASDAPGLHAFTALAGARLRLALAAPSGLPYRVTILDPDGVALRSWDVPAGGRKANVVLQQDGLHHLRIDALDGAAADYNIDAGIRWPKDARPRERTLRGDFEDQEVVATVELPVGARLGMTAVPLQTTPPLGLILLDPDGVAVPTAPWLRQLPNGGLHLDSYVAGLPGTYTVVVNGVPEGAKVRLLVAPQPEE